MHLMPGSHRGSMGAALALDTVGQYHGASCWSCTHFHSAQALLKDEDLNTGSFAQQMSQLQLEYKHLTDDEHDAFYDMNNGPLMAEFAEAIVKRIVMVRKDKGGDYGRCSVLADKPRQAAEMEGEKGAVRRCICSVYCCSALLCSPLCMNGQIPACWLNMDDEGSDVAEQTKAVQSILRIMPYSGVRRVDALAKNLVQSQYARALVLVMTDVLDQPETEVRAGSRPAIADAQGPVPAIPWAIYALPSGKCSSMLKHTLRRKKARQEAV
eukprot:535116-Pelagomonas_calceolata.AAC.8